jgi:hypothetical protein
VKKVCELCPSGTFSNDGVSCRPCPYATSSIPGAKTCSSTIRFGVQGKFLTYVPYGVSKINVRLWGAGGGGDSNYFFNNVSYGGDSSTLDPRAGGGGGFSACNISVIPNSFVHVIVGGGGREIFGPKENTGGLSFSLISSEQRRLTLAWQHSWIEFHCYDFFILGYGGGGSGRNVQGYKSGGRAAIDWS